MIPKIKIFRSGALLCDTTGVIGETLLERISSSGVFLDAPCGGKGKCGKCTVRVGNPEGEQVLACKTQVDGDMIIHVPDEMEMKIADAGTKGEFSAYTTAAGKANLGVGIDIGTTTVVAHLTDIDTGTRIATASGVNAQRPYGADVISRIQYCAENGHHTLTKLIRQQIAQLIQNVCTASNANSKDIGYISIAANTIMEHLAAGFTPVGMGVVPFTPVSLFGKELSADDDLNVSDDAVLYFAPAISSYVGGDITAGMLAAGLEESECTTVYLDIGTNGEIVLKHENIYYCCATAAGPAFEGAEITKGMAAVNGAINHIKWNGGLELSVIGNCEPQGLCGSGLLDALAVLLETGAVDETGRLLDYDEIDHEIAGQIAQIDGKNIIWLNKDSGVFMSASDIRKLQLAKSAIAAGVQTLLRYANINENQVKSFILAGGFGSFLDQNSAAGIGLFPRSFLAVAKTLGNTAGEGAALALRSQAVRKKLNDIRDKCEYIELSTSAVFNEQFVEQMMFDATLFESGGSHA